eukprot:5187995-Amphidinium_carterae.1
MVKAAITMSDRIQELQQNQQLLQKENGELKRTNKYLLESADLKRVTERLDVQDKQIKTLMSRAEHDRGRNKQEFIDVHAGLCNIFSVLARHEADMEGVTVREVARDGRQLGLVTDLNNRLCPVENVSYALTPLACSSAIYV